MGSDAATDRSAAVRAALQVIAKELPAGVKAMGVAAGRAAASLRTLAGLSMSENRRWPRWRCWFFGHAPTELDSFLRMTHRCRCGQVRDIAAERVHSAPGQWWLRWVAGLK